MGQILGKAHIVNEQFILKKKNLQKIAVPWLYERYGQFILNKRFEHYGWKLIVERLIWHEIRVILDIYYRSRVSRHDSRAHCESCIQKHRRERKSRSNDWAESVKGAQIGPHCQSVWIVYIGAHAPNPMIPRRDKSYEKKRIPDCDCVTRVTRCAICKFYQSPTISLLSAACSSGPVMLSFIQNKSDYKLLPTYVYPRVKLFLSFRPIAA